MKWGILVACLVAWGGVATPARADDPQEPGRWILKSSSAKTYFVPAGKFKEQTERTLVQQSKGSVTFERGSEEWTREVIETVSSGSRTEKVLRKVPLGIRVEQDGAVLRSVKRWREEAVERVIPITTYRVVQVKTWLERPLSEFFRDYYVRTTRDWPDEVWGRLTAVEEGDLARVREIETGAWIKKESRTVLRTFSREGPTTESVAASEDAAVTVGTNRVAAAVSSQSAVRGGVAAFSTGKGRGGGAARQTTSGREWSLSGAGRSIAMGGQSSQDVARLAQLARRGLDLVDAASGTNWRVTSDGVSLKFALRLGAGEVAPLLAQVESVALGDGGDLVVMGRFAAKSARGTIQSRTLRGTIVP